MINRNIVFTLTLAALAGLPVAAYIIEHSPPAPNPFDRFEQGPRLVGYGCEGSPLPLYAQEEDELPRCALIQGADEPERFVPVYVGSGCAGGGMRVASSYDELAAQGCRDSWHERVPEWQVRALLG